ncbi:hypothetical protein [Kitasatospora sp. NPDC058190]|uniref:hypothetical protein n=1 Tax=Kitasatospora sp. NPDC058190 TaxID=3346371 RepID=UPI0036DF3C09
MAVRRAHGNLAAGPHRCRSGADNIWAHVRGPATEFAIGARHLYRLAPDRGSLWQWDGTGETWPRIGGPAAALAVRR